MIYHLDGRLNTKGGFLTIVKLVNICDIYEFNLYDIDFPYEITLTQIGCLDGFYPNQEVDLDLLQKGLDRLAVILDDGDVKYDIIWRKTGQKCDEAVEAMFEHTLAAAGYDVCVYSQS